MLKAASKLLPLTVWIGVCCLLCWLAKKLRKMAWRDYMVRLCYMGLLRIIGIRLTVSGTLSQQRPLLLVSNHLSYLDVAILGSAVPVRFTPKSEVAKWPVIGSICRLCDAIFVERRSAGMQEVKQTLASAMASGDVVSLFPEATTGDGLHLHRFKSGFFSLAEEKIAGRDLHIQPAAITYTRIRRLPIDRTQWPDIAWYGDMTLAPHLFKLLSLGPIDAELVLLPPVTIEGFASRKELAARCRHDIAVAIEAIRERKPPAANKKKYMPKIAAFLSKNT